MLGLQPWLRPAGAYIGHAERRAQQARESARIAQNLAAALKGGAVYLEHALIAAKIIIKPNAQKTSVVPWGRVLLIRGVLLIVIALCIVVAIESDDRNIRGLAAGIAIVVEIIRDAVLAGANLDGCKAKSNKN